MRGLWPRFDELTAEVGVWSLVVVIKQKLFHNVAKLCDGVDDEVIEALGLEGLDEGFDVAVGLRATGRDALGLATDV